MASLVANVLTEDSKRRSVGQDDVDLFGIEDVKQGEWDYSLPTLTSGKSNCGELRNSNKLFAGEFSDEFPFAITWDNLFVAGGCPSSIVRRTNFEDIDFFIYGLSSKAEATARVEKFLQEIQTSHREIQKKERVEQQTKYIMRDQKLPEAEARKKAEEEKWEPDLHVRSIRNKNAITFDVQGSDEVKFQIILRIYKSKSEILHGFDLGSSAVGWDGKRLYFTSLGKFAHEYSCNIIDTTRRSTTYERRLKKYFERGFDIIIPALDMKQLSKKKLKYGISEVVDLPYFAFAYDSLQGNKLHVDRFLFHLGEHGEEISDYQMDDLDEHKIFYINLKNLSRNKEDFYFATEGNSYIDILKAQPVMSRRRVIDHYDTMKEKIERGHSPEIRQLRAYVQDLRDVGKLLVDGSENIDAAVLAAIEQEKERLLGLVSKSMDAGSGFTLDWRVDNPGSQLTGSFNPIFERAEQWYGNYYSKW